MILQFIRKEKNLSIFLALIIYEIIGLLLLKSFAYKNPLLIISLVFDFLLFFYIFVLFWKIRIGGNDYNFLKSSLKCFGLIMILIFIVKIGLIVAGAIFYVIRISDLDTEDPYHIKQSNIIDTYVFS